MTYTQRLMKPGRFDVRLKDSAPMELWNAIDNFDHIVITPNRLRPISAYSDANILAAAIFTGIVKNRKTSPASFSGAGLDEWLGTEEGLGDLLDVKVSNSAGSLSTWMTSLCPASLTVGTVNNTGTTALTQDYQFVSRREAMANALRAMGAEWRVNPNFTIDAATPANLHTNYTTPTTVLTRRPESAEGSRVGIEATGIDVDISVTGYTTKVIVVGKNGDGAQLATGSATGANVYKDGLNNNVVMERFVDAPTEPATNVAAYAQSVLNLFGSSRKSVELTSRSYAITTKVRPGDRVCVYDQLAGLVDTANQITWRGQLITPVMLRCLAITSPIQPGMGVYGRRSGATPTYYDLSDYVEYEDDDTVWEVGASRDDVDQDPSQLGTAFLGANGGVINRTPAIGQRSVVTLSADSTNNNATPNTLQNMTPAGLSFLVSSGRKYGFRLVATYDAAVTTTGSRWTVYCATGTVAYRSENSLTTTSRTFNEGLTTYQQPAACNASSAATTGNIAIVEGIIAASADDTVYFQFASEVASSAITAKAGLTYMEWWQIP